MRSVEAISWRALEARRSLAFRLAGGLLLAAALINGIDVISTVESQAGPLLYLEGVTGFGGVVVMMVGLLGLYPRLAEVAPRLARTGLALAVGPSVFFATTLVACGVLAPLIGFPSLKALVPAFRPTSSFIVLAFAAALTCFGVASLRTAVPSRAVGGWLVLVGLAWLVFVGSLLAFAVHTPAWVTVAGTAMIAGPLLAIGVQLRPLDGPAVVLDAEGDPTV